MCRPIQSRLRCGVDAALMWCGRWCRRTTRCPGINLAGDGLTNRRLAGTLPLRLGLAGPALWFFFGRPVPLRMGRDQHTSEMDADEPVSDSDLDNLASEPHADFVELRREADLPVTANLASRRRLNRCTLDRFSVGPPARPNRSEGRTSPIP